MSKGNLTSVEQRVWGRVLSLYFLVLTGTHSSSWDNLILCTFFCRDITWILHQEYPVSQLLPSCFGVMGMSDLSGRGRNILSLSTNCLGKLHTKAGNISCPKTQTWKISSSSIIKHNSYPYLLYFKYKSYFVGRPLGLDHIRFQGIVSSAIGDKTNIYDYQIIC